MPIDAAAIEAGLASPEFEKQRNMQRLLLGVDGKRYYGALCDVLASQNWQARGNAASLLSRIVPPSDAWCREALGRLIDRLDHEPVSDIRGVMERAKKVLEARIAHATGPVPNQIASRGHAEATTQVLSQDVLLSQEAVQASGRTLHGVAKVSG